MAFDGGDGGIAADTLCTSMSTEIVSPAMIRVEVDIERKIEDKISEEDTIIESVLEEDLV